MAIQAKIDIKSAGGTTLLSTSINEGAKGYYSLMQHDYIVLPFKLRTPIDFKIGSYVDLRGVFDDALGGKLAKMYYVTDLQNPSYNTSTGAYEYQLRLNAYYWLWNNFIFKYTPESTAGEASWSLTAPLDVQLGVFLRNLSELGFTYNGVPYEYSIDSTVENKAVAMTYDNTRLLDALFSMGGENAWDCDVWVTENVIHFGRCEHGDAVKIEIGVEASDMTRNESKGTFATRIYAFGSTRNIPENYRDTGNPDLTVNGIVQKRLMLPADTPYIDAYPDMQPFEVVECVMVNEAIYPKRIGTLSDVKTVDRAIEDGEGNQTGTFKAYQYKDTGLTFDEEYILEGKELRIVFKSGKLNGLDFGVTFNPEGADPAEQLWEIVANEDYGRRLPDEVMKPENGDKYILYGFNIKLVSDQYTPEAEQELKEWAQGQADRMKTDDGTYTVPLRASYVREDMISRTYDVGQKVNLVNPSFFGEEGRISRVIGWEMCLDIPSDNPVYTIGESAQYSRLTEIEDKVDSLVFNGQTYQGTGGGSGVYVIRTNDSTPASDSNVFSALRSLATFLRKDKSDSTKYLLSLLGGVLIKGLARFGEFVTGVSGGMIDEDGTAELESLFLRSELIVPAIRYNYMTYFMGYNLITPGGGIKVKDFADNGDGSWTVTPDLEEGMPCGQYVDDILLGYWYDKNEQTGDFAGFKKVQFRVTSVDYDAKTFVMAPRPGTDAVPYKQMKLGQTGNFTNENRQTYMILDVRDGNNCITFYDHANTWDPEPAQVMSWFGKKKGMTINGISCDGYSAVLQNILMTGLIFQIDEITGQSVRVPIDKGDWVAGQYGYYNRVSHNGSLWLCVATEGTSEEPGTGDAWLKQVSEGKKGDPGLSVVGGGHWESSKTPYAANTLVSFCNCVFLSNKETSNPPLAIARFKDGSYVRMKGSGYILAGKHADFEVNEDWDMLLDGRELQGRSITFLGSFATAPSDPSEGNSYYNTTDRCTYIWQNGQWMLMVSDGKDGTDYEYIYTRNNSIGTAPEKPDSQQQDDYVPSGWTDDFMGVSETFQVEWGCKRSKTNGVWSEWSTPAIVHRWSKNGEDGIGIESVGHWEHSKTPYTKNQLVNFGRGTFLALTETSDPPLAIARFKDGSYIRKKDGGYMLAGNSADMEVNGDWRMMSWTDETPSLYWLDCPVIAFNFTSTGSPSPSAVEVSCKQSRNGVVSDCTTLWLAARRYNGSWSSAAPATQGGKISVSAAAGYTQYVVRAYSSQSDANAWNANYVAERGIGVAQDGMQGRDGTDYEYIFRRTTTDSCPSTPATAQQDGYVPSGWEDNPQGVNNTYPYEWSSMRTKNDGTWGAFCTPYKFGVKGDKGDQGNQGAMGAFPYDRGVFKSGQSYVWNSTRRDKIIYRFNDVYYNFLVKNYGATVTAAPTSVNGDSNWEAMQKFESIVTDTLFADGANIGGLMFKLLGYNSDGIPYGEVRSQNTNSSGVPTFYLNTQTGYFHCEDVDVSGTINGVLKTLRTEGGEIVLNSGGAWFNGVDLYNQGTVNGRPLRFYGNSIWCRNYFGARGRLTVRVVGSAAYFYPNGTGSSYQIVSLSANTYNGKTYYTVPCYGITGDASGMPVDTIVFANMSSATRYYELGLADTQRVHIYNANDNYSVHLFINGNDKTLHGGMGCTVQQIPVSWMAPTVSSSTPGAGQLIAGEKDEDWA